MLDKSKKDIAWKSMEVLLDKHMPTKKEKRKLLLPFYFALPAASLALIILYVHFSSKPHSFQNPSQVEIEKSNSKIEKNYLTEPSKSTFTNNLVTNPTSSSLEKIKPILNSTKNNLDDLNQKATPIKDINITKNNFNPTLAFGLSNKTDDDLGTTNEISQNNSHNKIITKEGKINSEDHSGTLKDEQIIYSLSPLIKQFTLLNFENAISKPILNFAASSPIIKNNTNNNFSLAAYIPSLININDNPITPGIGIDMSMKIKNRFSISISPSYYKFSSYQANSDYIEEINKFIPESFNINSSFKNIIRVTVKNNSSLIVPLNLKYKLNSNFELNSGPCFVYEKNEIHDIEKFSNKIYEISDIENANKIYSSALENKLLTFNIGLTAHYKNLQLGINTIFINNKNPEFNYLNTSNNYSPVAEVRLGYKFISK